MCFTISHKKTWSQTNALRSRGRCVPTTFVHTTADRDFKVWFQRSYMKCYMFHELADMYLAQVKNRKAIGQLRDL